MESINSVEEWRKFMRTTRKDGEIWKVNFGKIEWQVQLPYGLATFGTLKAAQEFSAGYLATL